MTTPSSIDSAHDLAASRALFERAVHVMPGGVSSPVRAFRAVGGTPLFVARAEGAHFVDADGNRYLDFVQSWGPLILGHAHAAVVDAVSAAAARGLTYGAPHANEVELAAHVIDCYPGIEQVRFTSSGTEATMSAIRLARGVTGRPRLVKFAGCYHGHADGLLVAAGSGAVTFGEPSSAGVPAQIAALTSVLPLDDEAALDALFAACGEQIAAVIVEPIPANNGLLLQRRGWLAHLREVTKRHGAMLIFDEVISGFRVARGGAAELYGITPDIVTFGKILGGGMPCGAFAGSARTFAHLAPLGPVYHAGTLSGNPLAMAAGLCTLRTLDELDAWRTLERSAARFEAEIEPHLRGRPVSMVRLGSVFWMSFGGAVGAPAPRRDDQIAGSAAELYKRFFAACLERGVYLAPSAYEVGFVSTAHTQADLTHAAQVFGAALEATFA